jgi:hypothetical protein
MNITTKEGVCQVTAIKVGKYLGVHEAISKPRTQGGRSYPYWAITHFPTGLLVSGCFISSAAALTVAKELDLHLDWGIIKEDGNLHEPFARLVLLNFIAYRVLLFATRKCKESPSFGDNIVASLPRLNKDNNTFISDARIAWIETHAKLLDGN